MGTLRSYEAGGKCPYCSASVNPAACICPHCRRPLKKMTCYSCSSSVSPGSQFCSKCGADILLFDLQIGPFANCRKGDIVRLGSCRQGGVMDVTRIEWVVLVPEGRRVLLISRKGLFAKEFDDQCNDWRASSLRRWLNSDFLNDSFKGREKDILSPHGPTGDLVFVMDQDEACKYFANDNERWCNASNIAKSQGAAVENGRCSWWLRTPYFSHTLYGVGPDGFIDGGHCLNYADASMCVRPAIWVDRNKMNGVGTAPDGAPSRGAIIKSGSAAFGSVAGFSNTRHAPNNIDGIMKKADNVSSNSLRSAEACPSSASLSDFCLSFGNAKEGNIINFGRSGFSLSGSAKDLSWIVLSNRDGRITMMSRNAVTFRPFDYNFNGWEKSSIRAWLNEEFFSLSFDMKEKSIIESASGCGDKVFLLSRKEFNAYIKSPSLVRCSPESYVYKEAMNLPYTINENWWLRSSPSHGRAEYVSRSGAIYSANMNNYMLVRPALTININPRRLDVCREAEKAMALQMEKERERLEKERIERER
ncbi:MAG: zinc ribbon domain-containing protein, partial [bacterium]|nr:zinc ribbon domain-containing protein [bacterium]